jgi:hypothetical protein
MEFGWIHAEQAVCLELVSVRLGLIESHVALAFVGMDAEPLGLFLRHCCEGVV